MRDDRIALYIMLIALLLIANLVVSTIGAMR